MVAGFLLAQANSQESGQGKDHAHFTDYSDVGPADVELVVVDPRFV